MGDKKCHSFLESCTATDFTFQIDDGMDGCRLDTFLSRCLSKTSRSLINVSVRDGFVRVNEQLKKNSYRLKPGDHVTGRILQPEVPLLRPEPIPFTILFEDQDIIVLSKPPGLVVHPGSGNSHGTLVNGLLHHCRSLGDVGDESRPGIVHRLDKDTSGVMLVAKNNESHRLLVEGFQKREIDKEYLALVCGRVNEESGRIVAAIGRHPINRKKMAVRERTGRYAASSWKVEYHFPEGYTLLRVKIETGRTHQIRVHMSHLGFPVAGDRLYGKKKDLDRFPRQLLHAAKIAFQHPINREFMAFKAPLWPDFAAILSQLDPEVSSLLGGVS